PMLKIRVLKAGKRLPQFVKENDMVKLLDNMDFPDTFEGWRDRLVLELFYATGIRLSELINLRENYVDLKNHTIRVLGKRNKERVIPFPKNIVQVIEGYRKVRNREVSVKQHGCLFVTASGEPCYPTMIYRTVKKYITSVEKR